MGHARTKSEVESELNRLNTILWDNLIFIETHENSDSFVKKHAVKMRRKKCSVIQNMMRAIGWAFFKERDVESMIDRAYNASTGRTLGERRQENWNRRYENESS